MSYVNANDLNVGDIVIVGNDRLRVVSKEAGRVYGPNLDEQNVDLKFVNLRTNQTLDYDDISATQSFMKERAMGGRRKTRRSRKSKRKSRKNKKSYRRRH
jgi:hypothetical protein